MNLNVYLTVNLLKHLYSFMENNTQVIYNIMVKN